MFKACHQCHHLILELLMGILDFLSTKKWQIERIKTIKKKEYFQHLEYFIIFYTRKRMCFHDSCLISDSVWQLHLNNINKKHKQSQRFWNKISFLLRDNERTAVLKLVLLSFTGILSAQNRGITFWCSAAACMKNKPNTIHSAFRPSFSWLFAPTHLLHKCFTLLKFKRWMETLDD